MCQRTHLLPIKHQTMMVVVVVVIIQAMHLPEIMEMIHLEVVMIGKIQRQKE